MTRLELPAQAAKILRDVGDEQACDASVVGSLKLFLLPTASTIPKDATARGVARSNNTKSAASRSKGAKTGGKKQLALEALDCGEADSNYSLKPRERLFFATEIVNVTLRALTVAIKIARTSQNSSPKSKAVARSTSTVSKPKLGTPIRGQTPLNEICVNRVLQSPAKNQDVRRASPGLSRNSNCVRAQAECARVGLACLRSLQSVETLRARFAPLQLENGMSVLITKLLTLGYDDLAISELRILKRRIESLTSNLIEEPAKTHCDAGKRSTKNDATSQKDTLPDLLRYDNCHFSGSLLGLVVTSQIQVLKMLALQGHGPSIEAAVKHLRNELNYAPSRLAEKQINTIEPNSKVNAAHQLEILSQAIMRLCPSASKASDEQLKMGSYPSVQATLELQSLALQTRIRWWSLSDHQPDINVEVLSPLSRYLSAFERRCTIKGSDKYCIAKHAFNAVSTALHSWGTPFRDHSFSIFKILANQADVAGQIDEAIQWTERGLRTVEAAEGSRLQRCAFLCRLATYHLREVVNDSDDSQILISLRNAITGVEGDLSGDSSDLDELLLAVADLRKSAFSFVHRNTKAYGPTQIQHGKPLLGQCVQIVLLSIRFLARYTGREPASDATQPKVLRSKERMHIAKQMLPFMVASVIAVSRLALKSNMDEWQRFDAIFQDTLALSVRLGIDSSSPQEHKNTTDDSSSPHVSISSIYWLRFMTQKKMSVEAKDFANSAKKSIDVLEDQPSDEKARGAFLMKVEKYASLCEDLQDYKTSAIYYRKAIEFLISSSGITALAEAARLVGWPTAVAKNCEFERTTRIFSAYPKAMFKANQRDSESRIVFYADWLPNNQQGLILELQLTSLISMLLDRGSTRIMWDELQSLCKSILSLYVEHNFLAQRLHLTVQLLHLSAVLPMTPENSLLSKLLEQIEVQLKESISSCERSPQLHTRHLVSRIHQYRGLKEGSDLSVLEPILTDWWSLVQRCNNWQALEDNVYDIPGWLQQLDLVAEHLFVNGDESLRTAVLYLIVEIHERTSSTRSIDLASSLTNLGIHYARIGYSGLGGAFLQRAQNFLDTSDVPSKVMLQWCVANAEYNLFCSDVEKCAAFVRRGMDALQILRQSSQCSANDRTVFTQAAADLMFIQAKTLSEQGHPEKAFLFVRAAVQEYQRIWASLNRRMGPNERKDPAGGVDANLIAAISELSIVENKVNSDTKSKYAVLQILKSWYLSSRLFAGILYLSRCFAHEGLLSEAQYYLEQCQKIADATKSPVMNCTCLVVRGEYAICSGEIELGLKLLREVEIALSDASCTYSNVNLYAGVAQHYLKANQIRDGSAACDESMRRLRSLTLKAAPYRVLYAISQTEKLDIPMVAQRTTKQAQPKEVRVGRSKALKKPSAEPKREACPQEEQLSPSETLPLKGLRGEILRHSAVAELSQKSPDAAMTLLDEASALSQRQFHLIMHEILRSQVYLGRTFQQLLVDPVLSVLPESTICCPAVIVATESETPPKSPSKKSISNKTAQGKTSNRKAVQKKAPPSQDCLKHLPLARKCLMEIFSMAKVFSSTSTIHTISETLSKILTIFSVIPSGTDKPFSSHFMAYIIELGRQLAMDREISSIKVESLLSGNREPGILPNFAEDGGDVYAEHKDFDFSNFQRDYLDIIPKSWTVLSITLSKSNEEMWISRMRAGQSPFILRLPFNRENTSEHDEEGLTFNEGRAEMLEIIQLANVSAHSAGDLSLKGAKKMWWDTRATLDTRLKDLLTNIESIWLGGFRGIFNSEMPEPSLLARFEKSLQHILSKHLPSRRTLAKDRHNNQIRLDSRILELFVTLGAPTDENDVDEQLMDLLYFVVDILQFHKERNAYDEIDFDAIVVDTVDALRQYHQAAAASESNSEKHHTVLILDRNLHCFPWESMACTAGQSISRLPSLGCMRRRILQMREQNDEQNAGLLQGIHVDPGHGSYMLNPGGDLASTQAAFEESLRELSNWNSFVEREPSEADMKSCLQDNKIFLYFGHGSGGQYIRSRTIKKLDQCAVALLMGCSSGALTQAGEYEAYGTPISYMHAGCPALLATLWDVTDKDIDRFSENVLRRWGLFKEKPLASVGSPVKRSVKSKGKMKAKVEEVMTDIIHGPVSLDEAVAKSRDSCILKYLNGAAPVVYGIPVYIG